MAPEDPKASEALGAFYAFSGQPEKAVSEFRSFDGSNPKNQSLSYDLIGVLIALRQFDEARRVDQVLLKRNPTDNMARLMNGRLLIAERRYRDAAAELEVVIKADSTLANGYYFLGVAQKGFGLADLARSSFSKALQLSPSMTPGGRGIGGVECGHGTYRGSVATCSSDGGNQSRLALRISERRESPHSKGRRSRS